MKNAITCIIIFILFLILSVNYEIYIFKDCKKSRPYNYVLYFKNGQIMLAVIKKYETEIEAIQNAFEDYGFQNEFDGKVICDDLENYCEGWDGKSRRCECANRRVYWCPYKDDEGKYYVKAIAY